MAEKYLIVSVDFDDYDRELVNRQLDPGSCFQCLTHAEALESVARNRRWGIVPTIVFTSAWKAINRPARKGVAA